LPFVFYFFSRRRRHTRSKRDWSSDVCSSDLRSSPRQYRTAYPGCAMQTPGPLPFAAHCASVEHGAQRFDSQMGFPTSVEQSALEIGRASCRERVKISVVGVAWREKNKDVLMD